MSHDGEGGPGRFWRPGDPAKVLRMNHAIAPRKVRAKMRYVGESMVGWENVDR